MIDLLKKISLLWAILLIVSMDAHAMKRIREESSDTHMHLGISINAIPEDILKIILQELPLSELQVSFVNKHWYELSRKIFPRFYEFLDTYHKCIIDIKKNKNISHKDTCSILHKIRTAETKITDKKDERLPLIEAFLTRNFHAINETSTCLPMLLEINFKKYPERLTQTALLHTWATSFPSIKREQILWATRSMPLSIATTPLRVLADCHELEFHFINETDWQTKMDFARELVARNSVESITSTAESFIRSQNLSRAVEFYEIAFEGNQTLHALHYANAAWAHLNSSNKNFNRAAELYDIAFVRDPNLHVKYYVDAGWAHLNSSNKNFNRAAELYDIALEKNSSLPGIYYANAGRAHTANKNFNRAAELYDIALEKNPSLPVKYYVDAGWAHLNSSNKNFNRAAELYDIALEKNPSLPGTYYANAGQAHLNSSNKNFNRAAELYDIALEKNPSLPGKYYVDAGWAHLNSSNKNFNRAAELYDIALEKNSSLPGIYYANAGRAHTANKNFNRAAELYDIAFVRDPNLHVKYYVDAGWAHLNSSNKNFNRAAELYDIAFVRDPNLSDAHYDIASWVNLEAGKLLQAIELSNKMIAKGNKKLLFISGIAYLRLGNREEGVKRIKIFIENNEQINVNPNLLLGEPLEILTADFKDLSDPKYSNWLSKQLKNTDKAFFSFWASINPLKDPLI